MSESLMRWGRSDPRGLALVPPTGWCQRLTLRLSCHAADVTTHATGCHAPDLSTVIDKTPLRCLPSRWWRQPPHASTLRLWWCQTVMSPVMSWSSPLYLWPHSNTFTLIPLRLMSRILWGTSLLICWCHADTKSINLICCDIIHHPSIPLWLYCWWCHFPSTPDVFYWHHLFISMPTSFF